MKPGVRALGLAFSDGPDRSTLGGAVVRADRVAEEFRLGDCRVGGIDATDAIRAVLDDLDREDLRAVLVAGVAPAWFNLVDLPAVAGAVDAPVLSVSFEASPGLESALREHFSGEQLDRRLAVYRSLPDRREVAVNNERVFVRALGCDDDEAARLVRAFTPEGGRPDPLRVARQVARAGRDYRG